MPSEVILPRVDMDMATGKISKWLVEGGCAVNKGQPLFEIETDKAAMEIEAQASGTLRKLVDVSGEDIPVGTVVAWIYADGEPAADAPSASGSSGASARLPAVDPARVDAEDRPFDSALPKESRDTMAAAPAAVPDATVNSLRATPLARRRAREHGVSLVDITGSGPRGRIQVLDIERRAVAKAPSAPQAVAVVPDALAQTPPPRPATSSLKAAASALNIVRLREGAGAPILLVHGWGADVNSWRPFLSGQRLGQPVFGIDLPGHGASPLGAVASFAGLVDAIEAALCGANLGAVDLVGHSLGAATATAAAARGALDVRSLLLLSPAGLGPSINGEFLRGYLAATSEASLTPWMHELVVNPANLSSAFVRATLNARAGTALVETQRKVAEAVFPDATQAFSIRGDLARLTMPTRVVFGTADRIIPAAQGTGLPGLVGLHLLPQVGHMPHLEAREMVSAILSQLVGR